MRITLAVIALLCSAAVSQAQPTRPQAKPGPARPDPIELAWLSTLPARLGDLERVSVAADDAPAVLGGAIARYQQRGATATLYLWRESQVPVPDGIASPAVQGEFTGAASMMRAVVDARRAAAPQAGGAAEAAPRTLTFTSRQADMPELRCAQVVMPQPSFAISDFACVTGIRGRLFKLRLTIGHDIGADTGVGSVAAAIGFAALRRIEAAAAEGTP